MNTGQMIVQIPLGVTLPVTTPGSSTALPAQVGEQEGISFAGVLSGMASQGTARSSVAAATAKSAESVRSVGNGSKVAMLPSDEMPDVITAVQAVVVSSGQAVSVSEGQAVSEEEPSASQERVQPESLMSQNVALYAAEAQIAQIQQSIGRMPEFDSKEVSQQCADVRAAAIYAANTQISQMQATVPALESSSGTQLMTTSAENPGVTVDVQPQSDQQLRSAVVTPEIFMRQPQTSITLTEHSVGLEQATVVPAKSDVTADGQPRTGQVFRSAVVTTEGAVRQPQLSVTPSENAVGLPEPDASPAEIALRSVVTATTQRSNGLEQSTAVSVKRDITVDVQPRSGQVFRSVAVTTEGSVRQPQTSLTSTENAVGLPEPEASPAERALRSVVTVAPQVETATTQRSNVGLEKVTAVIAENADQNVVNENQVVDLKNTAARVETSKQKTAEIISLRQRDEVELSVDKGANPDMSAVKPEKGQMPVQPAGFRFSRSVGVEAALGGGQPISARVAEKTAAGSDSSLKVNVEQQLAKGMGADFNGSDAGSAEQGAAGFTQQLPDAFRTSTQHLSGINQQFSVDTASPTEARTLPSESTRPEGRENIAGQVRERLSAHDIKMGSEQIVLRLSPEHLGDIKVNLRLENQTLRVEMVAENRMARESLLQHVDSLKEALSRQNISMDKFSVTSGGSDAGSQNGGTQGEWRELAKNRQAQQWMGSGGYRLPVAETVPLQPMMSARAEHSMLDLHF